jgi:molybdate-binding protein/DNA-binding XRE family transcriptional regulator
MKQDPDLCNNLKQTRIRLGMSQQDLANFAGVSRQTISGVEAGQYAPSTTVALRLAKALGCQVEDLFWLPQAMPEVEAVPTQTMPIGEPVRLSLAKIRGRWIAHPLVGTDAFRSEMIPADGSGELAPNASTMRVRLLDDLEKFHHTIVIAGCTPALSLWARAAERWHPQLRIHWTFDNSTTALHRLCQGEVHIAGMHLYDASTGEYNAPFVEAALAEAAFSDTTAVLINLGVWEEGLLVQPGNPLQVKGIQDLARSDVRLVNREVGAGSRDLLERSLQAAQIPLSQVQGFDHIVYGHLEVAQTVAEGFATVGVSTASVAAAFGLAFIPLHRSRYDLVTFKSYLEEPPIQQLLSTLGHQRVLAQLEALGGYDISQTGEMVAVVELKKPRKK